MKPIFHNLDDTFFKRVAEDLDLSLKRLSVQLEKLSSLLAYLEMFCCFLEPLFYGILGSEQSNPAIERSFQVENWREKAASKRNVLDTFRSKKAKGAQRARSHRNLAIAQPYYTLKRCAL